MRKWIILLSIVCAVAILAVPCISCTSPKTVTVTETQTRTPTPLTTYATPVTTVIIWNIGERPMTDTAVITAEPPSIPHPVSEALYGSCFACHSIPPEHEGRVAWPNLCTQCHAVGPFSPNLIPGS
jgi:hypothetical protein